MLCNDCDKRHLCESLCPEAEAYVKQDQVNRREWPIPINADLKIGRLKGRSQKSVFSKQQREIVRLLVAGHSREEVREILNISRQTLNKQIVRMRGKYSRAKTP